MSYELRTENRFIPTKSEITDITYMFDHPLGPSLLVFFYTIEVVQSEASKDTTTPPIHS